MTNLFEHQLIISPAFTLLPPATKIVEFIAFSFPLYYKKAHLGGQNHHRVRGKCIVINPYPDIIAVNDESETELWPYINQISHNVLLLYGFIV